LQRLLITGATGFVGAELTRHLLPDNEIWAVTRRIPEDADPRIRWILQDLSRGMPIIGLPRRIDAVIHLAQSRDFRSFPAEAPAIYNIAADTTLKLLDWACRAGAKRFVLASTGGLYGSSLEPVDEVTTEIPMPEGPLSFYFRSKKLAEDIASAYSQELSVSILRYFFIYGSSQSPTMLMKRLLTNVTEGNPVQLQGDDGLLFNPVHISDAVRATASCALEDHPGVFNVAGPDIVSLRQVVEHLGGLTGTPPVIEHEENKTPHHLVASVKRASQAFGAPRITLDEGLADLAGADR